MSNVVVSYNSTSIELESNTSLDIQLGTVLLGIEGFILKLSYILMGFYMRGIFLFTALTMERIAECFIKLLNASRCNGQKIVHTYEYFYRSTTRLNHTLGWIIALLSIQTFFSWVQNMSLIIGKGLPSWLKVILLIETAVGTVGYYYVVRIAGKVKLLHMFPQILLLLPNCCVFHDNVFR